MMNKITLDAIKWLNSLEKQELVQLFIDMSASEEFDTVDFVMDAYEWSRKS